MDRRRMNQQQPTTIVPSASGRVLSMVWICLFGIAGCDSSATNTNGVDNAKPKVNDPKLGSNESKSSSSSNSVTPKSQIRWKSHGADVGVSFSYQNGESAWLVAMIESNGGGIGVIDYDRDGRWDFFMPGGGKLTDKKTPIMVSNGMFRQVPSFRFENCAATSRTEPGVCYSFGANVGDFDGDGLPDIFITGYAGQQLLKNMGDGTFEDATATAGFNHRGWSSSAAWSDIDKDGDLDLYVAHYGVWSPELEKRCFNGEGQIDRCNPADFVGEQDELWINLGDGRFEDASERVKTTGYRGIGVVACDYDADGWTDFYVTNDEDPKTMFRNLGEGKFEEVAARSGTSLGSRAIVDGSMGIAVGDYDGNKRIDFLVTNYQNEYCELYANQGNSYFTLGTRAAGLMALGQTVVGWGTAFFDADHDLDEDLMIVAGHTSRKPIRSTNLQKSYFLENVNRKRLISLGDAAGEYFQKVHAGRGMAIGDFDNDGDIDSIVSMVEQPVELLTNETPRTGNFLLLDLVGTTSNRDAVGAIIEVSTDDGEQIRHRFSGASYASTHASSIHFGVGKANVANKITIQWPSGTKQTLSNIPTNQRITVIEQTTDQSAG